MSRFKKDAGKLILVREQARDRDGQQAGVLECETSVSEENMQDESKDPVSVGRDTK